VAVDAVIEIEFGPVAYGTVAQVIGSGVGAVQSGVVAEFGSDQPVVFWLADLSLALTL
jgi:hypothetical protein